MNDYLKLIKCKLKYKDCIICSSKIEDGAQLKKCNIGFNCDIRKNVIIGEKSYVNNNCNIMCAKIGKYCSIGYGVDIGMFEHDISKVSTSPFLNPHNESIVSVPIIGNDVWIGSKASILQGIKIGNGAIIAAGAVVTKDVPDYAIVGGVPAKIIKYRFDENTIKKLLKIEWWNKSEEWIQNNLSKFEDVESFIREAKK